MNICISIDDGCFATKSWYKKEGYTVLSYDEWKAVNKGEGSNGRAKTN